MGGSAGGAVARPDHIVVVVEEDRAAGALGDANMPYSNSLASGGLVFTNSHGVNNEGDSGEMNYLALYSGSTQGILDANPGLDAHNMHPGDTIKLPKPSP